MLLYNYIQLCRLKLFHGQEVWDHRSARDLKTLTDFINSHISVEVKVQPTPLSDASFMEHITKLSGLHFIKFYAPWYGTLPCII